jgi:hypothetical protein
MIYTPKEAATKWCPFRGKGGRCIASECMFWRWIEDRCRQKPTVGYCGAAAVPLGVIK